MFYCGGREIKVTRRDFLKGTAGFVLLCGLGFGATSLPSVLKSADAENAVGPLLANEVDYIQTLDGGKAYVNGQLVFKVNGMGYRLLKLADGRHTLKQITEKIDRPEIDEDIADFYITLGKAGYLQNRVEVKKVSHEFNKV